VKPGEPLVITHGRVVVVDRVDLYRDGGVVAGWPGGSMYREPRVPGRVWHRAETRPVSRQVAGISR
jgi:hypothetical protein